MGMRTLVATSLVISLVAASLVFVVVSSGEPYSHLESVDAADELKTSFKTKDKLSFLSWDGVWQGTDIDTELILFPDETVKITHFGDGVDSVIGTYSTEGTLIFVSADFKVIGDDDWPPLRLKRDGDDLLLVPAQKTKALHYGSNYNSWPLRIKNDR